MSWDYFINFFWLFKIGCIPVFKKAPKGLDIMAE